MDDLPSLLPVSAGERRDAFWWAVALATALAVTVNAVWGTNLGIKGTSLRPSTDHSEELFGPDILHSQGRTKKEMAPRNKSYLNHYTPSQEEQTYWYAIVVRRSSFTALRTSARCRSVEMLNKKHNFSIIFIIIPQCRPISPYILSHIHMHTKDETWYLRTLVSSPRRSFLSFVRSPCARRALITPAYASNSVHKKIVI